MEAKACRTLNYAVCRVIGVLLVCYGLKKYGAGHGCQDPRAPPAPCIGPSTSSLQVHVFLQA